MVQGARETPAPPTSRTPWASGRSPAERQIQAQSLPFLLRDASMGMFCRRDKWNLARNWSPVLFQKGPLYHIFLLGVPTLISNSQSKIHQVIGLPSPSFPILILPHLRGFHLWSSFTVSPFPYSQIQEYGFSLSLLQAISNSFLPSPRPGDSSSSTLHCFLEKQIFYHATSIFWVPTMCWILF